MLCACGCSGKRLIPQQYLPGRDNQFCPGNHVMSYKVYSTNSKLFACKLVLVTTAPVLPNFHPGEKVCVCVCVCGGGCPPPPDSDGPAYNRYTTVHTSIVTYVRRFCLLCYRPLKLASQTKSLNMAYFTTGPTSLETIPPDSR